MKKRNAFLIVALVFLVGALTAFGLTASAENASPDLNIAALNLSFRNAIAIKYAVPETDKDVKLLIWTEPQEEYTLATADDVITEYNTVDYAGHFVFDYTGVAAKQMTDVIYARAYAEVDGEDCYGKLSRYSVIQYVYNKLGYTAGGTATTNDDLSALLEIMLSYGAKAQIYFDYNADRLANACSEWHDVRVAGGAVIDGNFTHGLYYTGDTAILSAPQTDANGFEFAYWKNSAGEKVATTATYEFTVTAGDIYTPVYIEKIEWPEWPKWPTKPSEGLEYDFDEEYGIAFVVGIGTCTDTVIVIASEYEGYPVTDIDASAFAGEAITAVYIPDTVTNIGNKAFQNCSELTDVYYNGTAAEWEENVSIGRYNNPLTDATIHFLPYLVTFVDYNGTVLKSEYVEAGESATAPADPTRENYIFTGWDVSFDAVESDITVKAQYKYDTAEYCVAIDEAVAEAGDTVELKLSILNNPGIAALNLTLNYDIDALTFDAAENGAILPTLDVGRNLFFSADDTCEGDGVLATLTFTVNEGAADGIYPISFTVNEAVGSGLIDIADEFTAVAGSVIVGNPVIEPPVTEPPVTEPPVTEPPVTEPPSVDTPETTVTTVVTEPVAPVIVSLNSVTVENGEATLALEIKDNPGVALISLTLDYDTAALTLEEIVNGSIFPTLDVGLNLLFSADMNCEGDGVLATLKFKVNAGAQTGTYPVAFVVNEVINEDLCDMKFEATAGSVIVEAVVTEPPVTEPPVTEPPVTTGIPEPEKPAMPEWPAASEGLEISYDEEEGLAFVDGIGDCTDTVIVIPAEYEGYPVVEISASAFAGEAITAVYFPNTIEAIANKAFQNCSKLTDVYYNGTPAEWEENVSVGRYNNPIADATMHFNPFLVTFVDYNGRVLKYELVDFGESATAPAAPTRENYIFTGWDVSFDAVESELTVTAQYKYDTTAPCIVLGDAVAIDGVASVGIYIQNNPGVAALNLTLDETARGWFDAAENGTIFPTLDVGLNLVWSADSNCDGDGVLATILFNVEGLEAGTYPITFSLNEVVSGLEQVTEQFTTVYGSIVVK